MRRRIVLAAAAVMALAAALLALVDRPEPRAPLRIVSGSENQTLEPLIEDWAESEGRPVEVTYLGSVDISRALEAGRDAPFDAVWPAHSLWIELGDLGRAVIRRESIVRMPVVLGLRRSIAERLGWVGRDDVTVAEIREAARAGAFRLAITSATQSNSGASAYLGFLYAIAGGPDVLTLDHLRDERVRAGVRDLLAQVDRSSGSSGWLKDSLVANPDAYDAMINYEALVIEANQALAAKGAETLYAIYPADGLAVADSPLGLISGRDPAVAETFDALVAHLLSPEVQAELMRRGRRAGLIGLDAAGADPAVWRTDWGVDPARDVAPAPTPDAAVIREALRLYQTELRKPSLTVWTLDVSGSMEGAPLDELKRAMALVLDPEAAAQALLQPSDRDVTIVIPFSDRPGPAWRVDGADPEALAGLRARVEALRAGGGTDLYGALGAAAAEIARVASAGRLDDYLPAIVAMTDGRSEEGGRQALLARLAAEPALATVPIHAIAFGDADVRQLEELNAATVGRLFESRRGLAEALRAAKGYN